MNKRIRVLAGLSALLALGSAGATRASPLPPCPATPVAFGTNPETGHYFEIYAADSIGWVAAKSCADGKSYSGIGGHLATVTSSSEDEWVDNLRESANLAKGQVWIGGSQQGNPAAPGDGWRWENGEGPVPGSNTETAFANWAAGEPNDGGDQIENGEEQHLTLGRFAGVRSWNDEGVAPATIGGFIVEYDVPRVATDCTLAGGCETVKGQTLTLPAGWVTADDSIKFTAYEFTDRRLCGQGELILFADPNDGKPELRIPPYLCGSPKFIVVAVNVDDSADLSFDRGGTVLIKNDTATVLPGNDADVVCKDTKGPIFLTPGEDPQRQDVVVYQTTDPGRMLEDLPANRGQDPQFAGAAGEFTDACGSSRGKGKELSYFVVGMRIDFGASAPTQEARHERFVALTLYKLSLLQQSVSLAKSAGALKNGDTTKMTAQLDNAVKKLGRGDPSGALGHVNQFLKFVAAAKYTQLGLDNNYNGEHLMRGNNIEFTLRVKVIPNAP